jgi:hypothetical protein
MLFTAERLPLLRLSRWSCRSIATIAAVVWNFGCDTQRVPEHEFKAAEPSVLVGVPHSIDAVPAFVAGTGQAGALDVFDRVRTPFLLRDGRLVIPIAGDFRVVVYSRAGDLEFSFGRRGNGPGEFQAIDAAWADGDTIEVYDSRLQRITRLWSRESYEVVPLRTQRIVETPVPGKLGGGWVLAGLTNRGGPISTLRVKRDSLAYFLFSRHGDELRELVRAPGISRYLTSAGTTQPEPLSPSGRSRISQERLIVGETLENTLRVIDSDGRLHFNIDLTHLERPDPRMSFNLVQQAASARPDPVGRPRLDYADAPVPPEISAFWDFLIDEQGFLWVLPYDPAAHAHALGGWRGPGPGGRWLIFTSIGEHVGSITVPTRLYPSQITIDAIIGIERDQFEVETVAVYNLTRH